MDDAIQRSKNATIIFRGQKDYSYKNYSSAQRKWILEDYVSKYGDGEAPYTNFICKAIEECRCWENKLLPKFYSKIGSEFSDLSALSIMQHYGLPTPLIDFTRNVVVALSFAVGTENHQSAEEDGYFSIYEVDVEKNIERIVKLSDNKELARKSYRDIAKLRRLFFIDTDNSLELNSICFSNLNIIAQDGVFLLNYHPWKYLGGWANELQLPKSGLIIQQPFTELLKNNLNIPVLNYMSCVDINKKLIPRIKSELLINLQDLFPNYNNMKQEVIAQLEKAFPK